MSKIKNWSHTSSSPDNQLLWELAQSVVCVPALLAADQLKLFEALAPRPLERGELAAKIDACERAVDILVDFLLPTNMLLQAPTGEVSLTPPARVFMLPASRFYFAP